MKESIRTFNFWLPLNLYERLENFCKEERFSKAQIVRTALERELRRRERKIQGEA